MNTRDKKVPVIKSKGCNNEKFIKNSAKIDS